LREASACVTGCRSSTGKDPNASKARCHDLPEVLLRA
jgi:hypothetical protein